MRRLAPALLALALLAATAPAASAQGLARVAYATDDDVFTIAADGSDRRHVAGPGASEPEWSPDAGSIAFLRVLEEPDEELDELGTSQIWVAAADGSGARAVSNPPPEAQDRSPTWSPDGQRIAFVRARYTDDDRLITTLVSAAATGGDERKIAEIKSGDYIGLLTAAWSPDGARILVTQVPYFGEGDNEARLYVVDVATGKRQLLVKNGGWGEWSPAGNRIVYVAYRAQCDEIGCLELHVARADGSGRRRLLTNGSNEHTPAWSADGGRIVFASDRNLPNGGNTELYSIRTDGSCLTWLTNGTATPHSPDLEPNSGLSSDPGGCGAVPRAPLIETDTSAAARYTRVPTWWLGPRAGNLMLSEVDTELGGVDFNYDDCVSYEPSDCPPPFGLGNLPVCSTSVLFEGNGKNVARFEGALVHTPPHDSEDGPQFFIGPTHANVFQLSEDVPVVPPGDLRRFPETDPPAGGLPRAELPLRFWRAIERTRAAVRKYGVAGAKRRLRMSRGRIENRIALDRRLRKIGPFGRLDCARK